jgi:hypothetical protein
MILRNVVNKFKSTMHIKKQLNAYYETVYQYSKARLVKLLNLASFKKLFTHFIDSGSLEEMLQTDRTLSININGYRKRVSKLTTIMLNGVDK